MLDTQHGLCTVRLSMSLDYVCSSIATVTNLTVHQHQHALWLYKSIHKCSSFNTTLGPPSPVVLFDCRILAYTPCLLIVVLLAQCESWMLQARCQHQKCILSNFRVWTCCTSPTMASTCGLGIFFASQSLATMAGAAARISSSGYAPCNSVIQCWAFSWWWLLSPESVVLDVRWFCSPAVCHFWLLIKIFVTCLAIW